MQNTIHWTPGWFILSLAPDAGPTPQSRTGLSARFASTDPDRWFVPALLGIPLGLLCLWGGVRAWQEVLLTTLTLKDVAAAILSAAVVVFAASWPLLLIRTARDGR